MKSNKSHREKTYLLTCVPNEVSNEHAHSRRQISKSSLSAKNHVFLILGVNQF